MTARKPADDTAATPAPGAEVMLSTLTRVFARLVVNQALGPGPASFRRIVTQQLHIATDAEVDVLEAWMTTHPGG